MPEIEYSLAKHSTKAGAYSGLICQNRNQESGFLWQKSASFLNHTRKTIKI
jgi:hypothetical protein